MTNRNTWLSLHLNFDTRSAMFDVNHNIDTLLPPRIRPMAFNDIHMTIIFFGKRLMGVKKTVLEEISEKIQRVVSDLTEPIVLEFDRYEVWPPEKHNLLVAIYKYNKHLSGIVYILKEFLAPYCDIDTNFVPHITIGKLFDPLVIVPPLPPYPDIVSDGLELSGNVIRNLDKEYKFSVD